MVLVMGLLVVLSPYLALAAVLAPAITMLSCRRAPAAALVLGFAAVALVVQWVRAGIADLDHADATGAAGHGLAGSWWLLGAVAAASVAVDLTVRARRRQRSNAVGCRAS